MVGQNSNKNHDNIVENKERIAIFIDGQSLYQSSRNLGFDVDYKKLLDLFGNANLLRANYFVAMPDTDDYSPLKPLTDWLSYNGYSVHTKAVKIWSDATGQRRVKGNVSVEIAVGMMELAPHVEHIILFSGDSDLTHAVETVKRLGAKVTAISTMNVTHIMVGDELRRAVDSFYDLINLKNSITRSVSGQSQNTPPSFSPPHEDADEYQGEAYEPAGSSHRPVRM